MTTTNEAVMRGIDAQNQLDIAINALDAVRDLCCEAAYGQSGEGLHLVNADNFACLLGLILDEMRSAQGGR